MTGLRELAYTTPRPDVFAMVPEAAQAILDVGCSNGALGESLRRARPGRRVTGIEGDEALAAAAAGRLDSVIRADLEDFAWDAAFGGEAFDCIIFADVLEHLTNPARHLAAARQHLRLGGVVVVSLPNIRHVSALYSIFIRGSFPRRERGIFDSTHLRWFTIKDARQLLADAGLRVERASYSLRARDRGGGLLNKAVGRLFDPVQGLGPVRELLSYQFCFRAVCR